MAKLRELIFLTLISFSGILWSTFLFIQETWRLMSYMIFGIIALTNAMVLALRITDNGERPVFSGSSRNLLKTVP
jgi:hypothetical protein